MKENKGIFIKPAEVFDSKRADYAPMFRKRFFVDSGIKSAVLTVCGLGYGYFWINGISVTEDLFTAPVSNYEKTLWYNEYDVTKLLKSGDNICSVICGNGWYNEAVKTAWNFDMAKWRDFPKFFLSLKINGEIALVSDSSWKYTLDTPVIYNQLRVGECFDSRKFFPAWKELSFDDSGWNFAAEDDDPPKGKFRKCTCEPIHECETISPVNVIALEKDKYIFDFGQNISGYTVLRLNQPAGDEIVLKYAEQINEDYSLKLNGMDNEHYYPESPFQTDRFICCGREFEWKPKFTYHGFRFVEVSGLKEVLPDTLMAKFVHQNIEKRTKFNCSDENLNKLFELGQRATLSNLFYMPTDCPTREKLGWMNDAQASAEQMLTDFEAERVLAKWWIDICDSMTEEGMLPGIVPTAGWGYEWGNGPVSEGTLYEIPYRIYLQTGDCSLLKQGLPYFKRHLEYLNKRKNEEGEIEYGLDDWASPIEEDKVNARFINSIFMVKFLKITIIAAEKCSESTLELEKELKDEIDRIKKRYINESGECIYDKQTAAAMLIYFGIYDELKPLSGQLARLAEEKDFHHDCGMVGIRYLYRALNICGLQEYAYKIITSRGFPSYMNWIEDGATALYERWNKTESKNHHMYSDFMVWMVNTLLGISSDLKAPGYKCIDINPYFALQLNYAEGSCNTVNGKISVSWKREREEIELRIEVPEGIKAFYKGKVLAAGENIFKE